jgi:hypothetical protein
MADLKLGLPIKIYIIGAILSRLMLQVLKDGPKVKGWIGIE